MPRFSLFKKPWEKEICTFELQEYGASGGKGWTSVTEPVGTPLPKSEAAQLFKPNAHYQLIAKSVETGRFLGVVWRHWEPHRGLIEKKVEVRPREERKKDVAEMIDEYVDEVDRVLTPVLKFADAMERIREKLGGTSTQNVPVEGEGGKVGVIPPPEFEGKLPVYMHPWVIDKIFDNLTGLVEFTATRFEKLGFGGGEVPTKPTEPTEEEEELLPSIKKYTAPEIESHPLEEEVKPETEGAEAEEEEEMLPSLSHKPAEEAETIPSLEGEMHEPVRACLRCGRADVPLQPNGLCDDCVLKMVEEAAKKEKEAKKKRRQKA